MRRSRSPMTPFCIAVLAATASLTPNVARATPHLTLSYAALPYTLAETCDPLQPLLFINLVLGNSGDKPTAPHKIEALEIAGTLSGEYALGPIAPGSALNVGVPVRLAPGSNAGAFPGDHHIAVTAGPRQLGPLDVNVPLAHCRPSDETGTGQRFNGKAVDTKVLPGAATALFPNPDRAQRRAPDTSAVATAGSPAVLVPAASPSPHLPNVFERRRTIDDVPARPHGLRFAEPGDCDTTPAVRTAAGGSAAACRDRLMSGGVIATWTPYGDPDCTEALICNVQGLALYDFRTRARVATVNGDPDAMVVPGATLGTCYVLRVQRPSRESGDSAAKCVTVLRTTTRSTYGPAYIEQFEAMIHDNADASYCTRHSWDSSWANESWGFTMRTHSRTLDPYAGSGDVRLQAGWISVYHAGTNPFPCREGLDHVWRSFARFSVPPASLGSVTSATLAFETASTNGASCFDTLWHANHWMYGARDGTQRSQTIGINDGRVLDPGGALGPLLRSGNRATYDLTADSFSTSGVFAFALAYFGDFDTSQIAHPTLHEGRYLQSASGQVCAAVNPHIDVVSVHTRTTAAPVIRQPLDTIDQPVRPAVPVVTPTPKRPI